MLYRLTEESTFVDDTYVKPLLSFFRLNIFDIFFVENFTIENQFPRAPENDRFVQVMESLLTRIQTHVIDLCDIYDEMESIGETVNEIVAYRNEVLNAAQEWMDQHPFALNIGKVIERTIALCEQSDAAITNQLNELIELAEVANLWQSTIGNALDEFVFGLRFGLTNASNAGDKL